MEFAQSQTFAPSLSAMGNHVHLSAKHFWLTVIVAALAHGIFLILLSIFSGDSVTSVPVRTLNIKIGGGDSWRSDPIPMPAEMLAPPLEVVDVSTPSHHAIPDEKPGDVDFSAIQPASQPQMLKLPPQKKVQAKPKPVAKAKPKEKRVKVTEKLLQRQRPVQNPAPAMFEKAIKKTPEPKLAAKPVESPTSAEDVLLSNIRLPKPEIRRETVQAAVRGQLAPAILPQPTQFVRDGQVDWKPLGGEALGNLAPAAGGKVVAATGSLGAGDAFGEMSAKEIKARYTQKISGWIKQHQVYPDAARERGQRGEVTLRIRIDRQGNIKFSSIESATGFPLIDKAALVMVKRANPVPKPPKDFPGGHLLEFLLPVKFGM